MNLKLYGFSEDNNIHQTDMPARITAVHKERYELVCENGMAYAKLKSGVYYNNSGEPFPTTGDFVLIQYNKSGDSQIVKTLERKTFFARLDPTPGRGEQAVAANFDYVFIIASLNKDFNINRIERYLTLAWQSGALPVIILTKADLVDDYTEQLNELETVAIGVDIVPISAYNGHGLSELQKYMQPAKTIVFLGSSGVGKSTLANALAGTTCMEVNTIREDDAKGRHTTTHRQLIMLDNGAMIIDTPGMRELGMWDVSDGISEAFSDVDLFLGKCKFSDCSHGNEPGCAIKGAIQDGQLSNERWEHYLSLKKEAKFNEDKFAYLKEKDQWHKDISKILKQKSKHIY